MTEAAVRLRERRRSETIEEIKAAALELLAESGPDGLALRAVGRRVGVSAQALYHYFPSRADLITVLISDAFTGLADAVRGAGEAVPPGPGRVVAAGLAYRQWAVDHPSQFLLALGVELPDYEAPENGPTSVAAQAMGRAFLDMIFGGWTREELEALGDRAPDLAGSTWIDLPTYALAEFTGGWATLHGVVVLELLGHLPWLGPQGEAMCRFVLTQYAERVQRPGG